MLCGKELILATKPFAKEIRSKSWIYTLTTILFLGLSLTATIMIPFLVAKIIFQYSCRTFNGSNVHYLP